MSDNRYENYDPYAEAGGGAPTGQPLSYTEGEKRSLYTPEQAPSEEKAWSEAGQEPEPEKQQRRKPGIGLGILIGAVAMGLVCAIVVLLFSSKLITEIRKKNAATSELALGNDVTDKMNLLMAYIQTYFLYGYDTEEMETAIYKAIVDSLDETYSAYYTPEEYAEIMQSTNGTYSGIGVVVSMDAETKEVQVIYPYEGSPGEEAGILPGDIIIAVNGTDVAGMDLTQVVSLIRGEEGTMVTVTVRRGEESLDFEMPRKTIEVITVAHELREDDIGYIQISGFDGVTLAQFKAAVDDLNTQGMKGLVIDIRDNPGGRLDIVVGMLDYLLPEGTLVYTLDKSGNRQDYSSDASENLGVPCAILVNGNSASASEIFAGAMQDYDKAEIIGTQTYGKGIVQSIFPLEDGSAIKLTVQDYYTPNGNNIHGVGITPDQVVELDVDAYKEDGTDTQLNAALEYLTGVIQ